MPVAAAAQAAEVEARARALVLYELVLVCDRRFHAACVIFAPREIFRVHKADVLKKYMQMVCHIPGYGLNNNKVGCA